MPEPRSAVPQEQIPLFGGSNSRQVHSPRPAPLARNSDPPSSHIAAAEITANGARGTQTRAVLAALRSQPSACTSMELAHAAGISRYTVARRLPDAERDGLVERGPMRECMVSGRMAITWKETL